MLGECFVRVEIEWNISALCSLVVLGISSAEVIYRVKKELPCYRLTVIKQGC
jgi:hypothetical protein